MNIQEIEGIGPAHGEKLAAAGVATTADLLERGARPRGRAELAEATGLSPKLILEWVNHVDLMRLDGVGSQYADLLEAAGVDSPLELARRNPANLAQTFQEIDAARPDMVRRLPSLETVTGWIQQAKTLDRAVFHEDGGAAPVEPKPEPVAAEREPGPPAVHEREPQAAPVADPEPEPEPAPAAEPDLAPEPRAEAEPEAEHKSAPAAVPEPAPAPVPRPAPTPAPMAAPAREAHGLWARIKRMIGRG